MALTNLEPPFACGRRLYRGCCRSHFGHELALSGKKRSVRAVSNPKRNTTA